MRFLLAPTAYKGTLTPIEAVFAMAEGIAAAVPQAVLDLCPMADGGTGWLDVWAFHRNEQAERYHAPTVDALERPLVAEWLLVKPHTAIVESAQACGIHRLMAHELAPMDATSAGVGHLLRIVAAHPQVREIWLGLGGTASTDGGIGALQALGYQILDSRGHPVPPNGHGLAQVAHIHPSSPNPLQGKALILCADAENPMTGSEGSARVYAPQKGADAHQVSVLETGLARWADLLEQTFGIEVAKQRGSGAAGGLAGGLSACLNAPIVSGIGWLMHHIGWSERLAKADYLFTGEGQVDAQTLMGKGVGVVVQSAVALGKPVFLVAGRTGAGSEALHYLPDVTVATLLTDAPHSATPAAALRSLCETIARRLAPSQSY